MSLPSAPKLYSQFDQDAIRKILSGGVDDTFRRLMALETAPPPAIGVGKPVGPFSKWTSTTGRAANTDVFSSGGIDAVSPNNIIARLTEMAKQKHAGFLNMTTGHSNYITATATYPNGVFDIEKFKHGHAAGAPVGAGMDAYNTQPIKDAVAQAVADGWLLGASVFDEPPHQTWNNGVLRDPGMVSVFMTKALVDECATYCRGIFPTVAWGAIVTHNWPGAGGELYQSLDWIAPQYESDQASWYEQPYTAFLAAAKIAAKNNKVSLMTSINYLAGGTRIAGCPTPATGGPYTDGVNCIATAAQIELWGTAFLSDPQVAGMFLWKQDPTIFANPAYQTAFTNLAATAAAKPKVSLFRSK